PRFLERWTTRTRDESGATIVHYLGVMPAILLNMPPSDDETAHRVKFGFGAGVNPKHHAPFEERFGFPLVEAWAMTETGAGGCIIANREPRHVGTSCFGKPEPAVETRIVDEEDADVPTGGEGELLVRAAGSDPRKGFFTSYHKNPEETAKAWEGGWLHTGDVVRVGPDGAFHFVDRRKNVIRRSGENISALEVEAVLSLNPAIDQVVVAAVPDEMRGDEVLALIILKPGGAGDRAAAEAIFADAMADLVYFKAPGYVAFVDAFPLTASQKPKRADVKALGRTLVEEGAAFDLRALKKRPKMERSAAS
ncbi:MAG: AMP-binding protein, partial [Pseudomonadota bacterium]